MNKIKLLSSLSTLMVASTATPIIATSCSSYAPLQIIIDSQLTDKEIISGDKGYVRMSCVAYNNETVSFKNVIVTCDNENVVCKVTTEMASYSTGEIQVDVPESIKPGTKCTIFITCEDEAGHTAHQNVKFDVIDHKFTLNITNPDGSDPFQPISTDYGADVIIMNTPFGIAGDTKRIKNFGIGVVNGTRTDDADVIPYATKTYPHATIDGFGTMLIYSIGDDGNKELHNASPEKPDEASEWEAENYWKLSFDLYTNDQQDAGEWTTITGLYLAEAEATVYTWDEIKNAEIAETITTYFLILVIPGTN